MVTWLASTNLANVIEQEVASDSLGLRGLALSIVNDLSPAEKIHQDAFDVAQHPIIYGAQSGGSYGLLSCKLRYFH